LWGVTAIATKVNTAAEIRPSRSWLKLSSPIARPPRTTVNCSHDRKVRSLAKKTTLVSDNGGGGGTFWFDSDGEGDSGAWEC
jgi:hypothetical protein